MTASETYTSVLEHFARYFDAVDRADIDEVMRILYGATLVAGAVETANAATIRTVYESRRADPTPEGARRVKHHVSNVLVEAKNDATVHAAAYYLRLEPGESGPVIAVTGRLHQTLTENGDRWRVHRHEIITDI